MKESKTETILNKIKGPAEALQKKKRTLRGGLRGEISVVMAGMNGRKPMFSEWDYWGPSDRYNSMINGIQGFRKTHIEIDESLYEDRIRIFSYDYFLDILGLNYEMNRSYDLSKSVEIVKLKSGFSEKELDFILEINPSLVIYCHNLSEEMKLKYMKRYTRSFLSFYNPSFILQKEVIYSDDYKHNKEKYIKAFLRNEDTSPIILNELLKGLNDIYLEGSIKRHRNFNRTSELAKVILESMSYGADCDI